MIGDQDPNVAAVAESASPAPQAAAGADDQSWGDSDPVAPSGAAYLKTLPPDRAAIVQAIASGHMDQLKGFSLKSPEGQQIMSQVFQYNPQADVADAPARTAARKAFTSGKYGQNITSFNTALDHLGVLNDAVTDLGNVQSPIPLTTQTANSWRNWARDKSGDPSVSNFNATVPMNLDELVRAFRGTGGNEADIARLENAFNSSQSPAQQRGVLQQWAKLLAGRINEIQHSYNTAMGTTAETVPGISPDAQARLQAFLSKDYLAGGAAGPAVTPPITGAGPAGGAPGAPPSGPTAGPGSTPPGWGGSPAAPTAGPSTVATGDMRTEDDPEKSAQLEALIRNGGSMGQINAIAPGTDPAQVQAVRDYLAKHPDYAGFARVQRQVPNTVLNKIAASAPVAALTQLGDSVTLGTMPKVVAGAEAVTGRLTGDNRSFGDIYTSDLADVEHDRDASAATHPLAALSGNMAGFMVGDAALGKAAKAVLGPSRIAAIPAALRPAVGDALYGGAYGLGSSDHLADVPENVASGAALSVLGGTAGRGILSTGAALAKPLVSDATRRLADAGITLTPGQIAGATGTRIGNLIKTAEDKATSLPIIGDGINMARRSGIEDFNRATGNKVLASIDQELPKDVPAGHGMLQYLQNAVSDAYDKALTPLRANADKQLGDDFTAIKSAVRPDQQDAFQKVVSSVVKPHLPSGNDPITGSQLQMIKRGLNEKIAQFKNDANGADLAGDLEDLRDSFMQFAERADPKNAAAYRSADAANAKLKRVEMAASGTKDGVFSPQQFRTAVGRRGYGTTTANLAAGTAPMQDLATDASTILPSTVPDSGTGGRLLFNQMARHLAAPALGGSLGALGDGKEGAVTGAALGAGLYSRPGMRIAQKVLIGSRGKTLSTLGDLLRDNSNLGGAAGAPLLIHGRGYQ